MAKPTKKQATVIAISVVIVGLIIYGFLPGAVPVDTETVRSAPMQVLIEEEGETYVAQHFIVSSPVSGFMRRIDLEAGDIVSAGEALAEFEPPRAAILDPRSRAEAVARVEAAEASFQQAETRAEQAATEQGRIERLAAAGSATQQQLEQVRTEASRATAALDAARAELAAARSAVDTATDPARLQVRHTVRAPVSGQLLTVHQKSEGFINAGVPLFEIGDTDSLEVRVDVLSRDAVRISPGMRVMLEQWGGDTSLEATVTRVERQGRVVISALGVEERRVRVVAKLRSNRSDRGNLGSGYRVLAQIVVWEDDDVLQVPTSALFRTDEAWSVFVVEGNRAVRRSVTVGHQSGLSAQIIEGLSAGDVVIVHPGADVEDGGRVNPDR